MAPALISRASRWNRHATGSSKLPCKTVSRSPAPGFCTTNLGGVAGMSRPLSNRTVDHHQLVLTKCNLLVAYLKLQFPFQADPGYSSGDERSLACESICSDVF